MLLDNTKLDIFICVMITKFLNEKRLIESNWTDKQCVQSNKHTTNRGCKNRWAVFVMEQYNNIWIESNLEFILKDH